jgi:hypothetical protein
VREGVGGVSRSGGGCGRVKLSEGKGKGVKDTPSRGCHSEYRLSWRRGAARRWARRLLCGEDLETGMSSASTGSEAGDVGGNWRAIRGAEL